MQGKVLLAVFVVGCVMGVFYLRSMGPRCGDERCDEAEYCQVSGDKRSATYVCEELHERCGFWPTCSCLDLPPGYECSGSLWGHLRIRLDAP